MIKVLTQSKDTPRHAILPLLLVAALSISTTVFAGDVLFVSDSETDAKNIPAILSGDTSEVPHSTISGAGFRPALGPGFYDVTIIRNDYDVTGGTFGLAEGTNPALMGDLFGYCSVFWSASGPHEPLGLFPDRIANGSFENVNGTHTGGDMFLNIADPRLTGWTIDQTIVWNVGIPASNGASAGVGFVDLSALGSSYGQISQALTTETGKTYQLSIDRKGDGSIVSLNGAFVLLTAGDTTGAWTTYTTMFTATSETTNLVIQRNPADLSGVAGVDSVSFVLQPQNPGLGADGGLHTDPDVFSNLNYYVGDGGFVFVTGHDAIAHPHDFSLIEFVGGTGAAAGQQVNPNYSTVSGAVTAITNGSAAVVGGLPLGGGINQVDTVQEQDYLAMVASGPNMTVLVNDFVPSIFPAAAAWTVRHPYGPANDFANGHIAYVANGVFFYETDQLGADGVTIVKETLSDGEDPSWLTPPYRGALLNFAATSCLTLPAAENPIADNQSVSTPQDTAVPITLTGSDPNSDPFTFVMGTPPAFGELGVTTPATGSPIPAALVYTPNSGFLGSDSFTFLTNDGTNDSAPGTVSIQVVPIPPFGVDVGPDTAINEGDTFVGGGSFFDPGERSPWTATVDYGEGAGPVPLALNPDKSFALNNAYANDDAVFPVTVEVTNDDGDVASDTLLVVINNVPPAVDAGPDDTINEGDTFASNGSFTDPGADVWMGTVDYDDGGGPEILPLNPDKSFALSHAYATAGVYTVEVTVTDDDGGVGMDTATVTVDEVVPQAMKCDLDADGDIDRADISVIFGLRGTTSPPSDPNADLDDNGIININDGRGCVLRCTRPRCAVE